ncbi:MAG: glycosyltransferase family 2 protein [Myxococcales bacterium]|nr:glycosyltransferase family 2 protein [Myxococcota bacterium]MDW8284216.1 glycosyltransferase family 2 protein [Myxococcales bacterium]
MPLPFQPSLTLLIPAFNERDNLPAVLQEAQALAARCCRDCEVLVVDDGSTDGTAALLAGWTGVRVITHERNRGLTAALRTGLFASQREFVTWVPADGQIPLSELARILDAWQGEDLVLSTYRRRPDGWTRIVMSRTLRLLVRAATGLRDRLEGPYLVRRALLDELDLVARTSAGSIGLEIAAKARALGKRLGSVEIECMPRRSGRSKVANLRNILSYLGEIWRIGASMRRAGLR